MFSVRAKLFKQTPFSLIELSLQLLDPILKYGMSFQSIPDEMNNFSMATGSSFECIHFVQITPQQND